LQTEAETQKEENALNKQIISQLELKISKQEKEGETIKSTGNSESNNVGTDQNSKELQKQLLEEKKKMQQIASLLSQMRVIAIPNVSVSETASFQDKWDEEKKAHQTTIETLKKITADNEELKKRMKKLNQVFQNVTPTNAPVVAQTGNAPPTIVPQSSLTTLAHPMVVSKLDETSKKKIEDMNQQEKVEALFLWLEAGKMDDITKLVKKNKTLVSVQDISGRTPLHIVCFNANAALVKFFR